MAKLKIFVGNDPTKAPGTVGYINVAKELLAPNTYQDFLEAEPAERADLLNVYAGKGGSGLFVQHETQGGVSQQIDKTNCKVMVEEDIRKLARKSKHTISFPDVMPSNDSLVYLQPYLDAIIVLNTADPKTARQFMFGMMLLTRCR